MVLPEISTMAPFPQAPSLGDTIPCNTNRFQVAPAGHCHTRRVPRPATTAQEAGPCFTNPTRLVEGVGPSQKRQNTKILKSLWYPGQAIGKKIRYHAIAYRGTVDLVSRGRNSAIFHVCGPLWTVYEPLAQ